MRHEARVAVIGGGVAGLSTLYHLALLGCTDTILLEQHELTSGTTWHAAGLCTQYSTSATLMGALRHSIELYRTLDSGFHPTGSIRLAPTADHLDELRHVAGVAQVAGVPFELISPERAAELCPQIDPSGLVGAAHLPTDGWADPARIANAYAHQARDRGAQILRHTAVTSMERTSAGWRLTAGEDVVEAAMIVCAGGMWTGELLALAGARVPLVALPHHYVFTESLEELADTDRELTIVRDPAARFYVRQDNDALLVGPFEDHLEPWAPDGIPLGWANRLIRPDMRRILPALEAAAERVPRLGDVPIRKVLCGADAYTPDGRCLMGPVPGLRDVLVLSGFSIFGIVWSGGAGRAMAEWIVDGRPHDTMWEVDVRRYGSYAGRAYTGRRAVEVYVREYDVHRPEEQWPAGRPLKTDPIYDLLAARGAVFAVRDGWERPAWFAGEPGAEDRPAFRRADANWHEAVAEECRAVRSDVGVLDQTSFAKFRVRGPDAAALLNRLSANALPTAPGVIRLCQLLNHAGGIECDVTITRTGGDGFLVVSAAAAAAHDLDWLERNRHNSDEVAIEDVSARYGVLTLAGPRSRDLLARLTRTDVSHEAFPFFTSRELEVGMAPVRAMRLSYVGELGYELHHPIEYQRHLYTALVEAGADLGLRDFGYRALESLRLEKGYRLWGADMSADWSPLQAGMERFVKLDKGDFLGRDALVEEQRAGSTHVLVTLVIDDAGADAHGYEPVFAGGAIAGYVASGGFGYTVDRSLATAYLPVAVASEGAAVEVEILGEHRPAVVTRVALHDPANERLRA
jgi:dimethylglycine dehydrogenase